MIVGKSCYVLVREHAEKAKPVANYKDSNFRCIVH
jgi:hypothetical protein